jgi:hypothetical protein
MQVSKEVVMKIEQRDSDKHPVLVALDNAPLDDEPETLAECQSVERAASDGERTSLADMRRALKTGALEGLIEALEECEADDQ